MNLNKMTASILDEMISPSKIPGVKFDLSVGVPDEESLPSAELLISVQNVLKKDYRSALIYAGVNGFVGLRLWIANKANQISDNKFNEENVSLVSGSAHGLDNIARTFLDFNDVVIISSPTYNGAIRTFKACNAEIIDINSDDQGMDIVQLQLKIDQCKKEKKNIKLLYLVSDYNNPTGESYSLERKKEIVKLCYENNILIIDDRAYAEISFEDLVSFPLIADINHSCVIELGTFSKTIATGLRVAWILADESIIKKLNMMRFDNGGSNLIQRTIHNFVDSPVYPDHLLRLKSIYKIKRDIVSDALQKYCLNNVEFNSPQGGFYHWVKISSNISNDVIKDRALNKGVAINSGSVYYSNNDNKEHLRIVYSKLDHQQLEKAIKLLSECFY